MSKRSIHTLCTVTPSSQTSGLKARKKNSRLQFSCYRRMCAIDFDLMPELA